MSHFSKGFTDELVKMAGPASLAAGFLGGRMISNAISHAIMNTKFTIPAVRGMIEELGNQAMMAGVRHGISGQRMGKIPSTLIGVAGDPSVPYMYNMGIGYGKRIKDVMEKVPLVRGTTPFKVIRGADTAVSEAMRAAPMAGAATGATYGYLTGKTKREPLPIKAILAGALTGGLIGKGVKAVGPHAPVVSQLKTIRTNVADPIIEGAPGNLGRLFDALAKLP